MGGVDWWQIWCTWMGFAFAALGLSARRSSMFSARPHSWYFTLCLCRCNTLCKLTHRLIEIKYIYKFVSSESCNQRTHISADCNIPTRLQLLGARAAAAESCSRDLLLLRIEKNCWPIQSRSTRRRFDLICYIPIAVNQCGSSSTFSLSLELNNGGNDEIVIIIH